MVVSALGACGDPKPEKQPRRTQASEADQGTRDADVETAPDADADPASDEPGSEPSEPDSSGTPDAPLPDQEPIDASSEDEPTVRDPIVRPEVRPAEPTPRCTGSELVTTQAYLDAFFKGCKTIGDSVYIDASGVENLDALSEVESIAGDLVIGPGLLYPHNDNRTWNESSARLKSLAGLSKLRQVGSLVLRALPLEDLSGLEQLRWGNVSLKWMKSLKSLRGLGEGVDGARLELTGVPLLESLAGLRGGPIALVIEDAAALRDLSGGSAAIRQLSVTNAPSLLTLTGVSPGDLTLKNAPLLRDLAGLRGSTRLNYLKLIGLPSLRSLMDLTGVKWMGGLWIEDCDGLEDLKGLELVPEYEVFNIHDCANLRSLTGLEGLTSVFYGLELRNLPALQTLRSLGNFTHASALILKELPSLADLSGLDSLQGLSHLYLVGAGPKSLQGLVPLQYLHALTAERTSLESLDGLVVAQLFTLTLTENPKLARIDALRSLTGGLSLVLTGNPALVDLGGLEDITRIGRLTLLNNVGLRDLRALSKVDKVSEAQILGNVQLPQCEIVWLATRAGFEAQHVESNGPIGSCAP